MRYMPLNEAEEKNAVSVLGKRRETVLEQPEKQALAGKNFRERRFFFRR